MLLLNIALGTNVEKINLECSDVIISNYLFLLGHCHLIYLL